MRYVNGDLFDFDLDVIAHGVNTFGVMGAGIALQFRDRFPKMFREYKSRCDNNMLNPGKVHFWVDQNVRNGDFQWGANIASQDYPGPYARLDWLEQGLTDAMRRATLIEAQTFTVPWIGCGIGGLDQDDVDDVYKRVSDKFDIELVVVTY